MIKYKLFQVKTNLTRNYGFMELSLMESMGIKVNLDNYDLVYESSVNTPLSSVLEDLFKIFNIDHPEDFHGRSMSVSDIVQIYDEYFYCDSFGWVNVKKTLKGAMTNDKT